MRAALFPLAAACALWAQPAQVPIDAPRARTPADVVEAMLAGARLGPGDVLYDLGCGDGRIAIAAARKGARAVCVDNRPEEIETARANARRAGLEARIRFRVEDLFDTDLGEATVVTLYLLADVNLRLRPKLRSELKRGARVVSHAFDMGDWKPDRVLEARGARIYLWTIP